MGDMRHRDGKLKVMHTIIGDFGKILRQIASLDEVESILTGTIAPSKSYKDTLTFQYFTDNGLKLLAKTTSAVQEIFIVTSVPDVLLDELQKMGFIDVERADVRHNPPRRRKRSGEDRRDEARDDLVDAPLAVANSGRKAKAEKKPAALDSSDPLTVKQMLSKDALCALMKLKDDVTPKPRTIATSSAEAGAPKKAGAKKSVRKASRVDDDEDFASLFAPADDEESFEDLLNKSSLDPKFFK